MDSGDAGAWRPTWLRSTAYVRSLVWWVSVVAMVSTGCGFFGSDQVEVEVIDVEGSVSSAHVTGPDLWIGQGSAQLLRIDHESGTVTQQIELPDTEVFFDLLFTSDGSVLFYSNYSDGPIDGVPLLGDEELFDMRKALHIITVDLTTGQPTIQYVTESVELTGPPILGADRWFWYHDGARQLFKLDLETGETSNGPFLGVGASNAFLIEGWIWHIGRYRALKIDPISGNIDATISDDSPWADLPVPEQLGELDSREEQDLAPPRRFWQIIPHAGKYWLPGETQLDPENMYEFDLESGDLGDKAPTQLPKKFFISDFHHWECCNDGENPSDEDATWTRYDLETHEQLGEHQFGRFAPTVEHEGYLWLISDDELGRVPLSALTGGG